jgi:hypothetical protein
VQKHRQRFKDLKSCLNDDDGDDAVNNNNSQVTSRLADYCSLFSLTNQNINYLQDPSNSSTKSADAASRNTVQSSHPFRVIDNDGLSIHSMQSLGRVGRILSGSLEPGALTVSKEQPQQSQLPESPSNNELQTTTIQKQPAEDSQSLNSSNSQKAMSQQQRPIILQEPDVIASTKLAHSKTTDSVG